MTDQNIPNILRDPEFQAGESERFRRFFSDNVLASKESTRELTFGAGIQVIDCFSTLFAEWTHIGGDLVVHLFPRNGVRDTWYPGRHTAVCRSCRRTHPEVGGDGIPRSPCPACRSRAFVYQPGRGEIAGTLPFTFPQTFRSTMKAAADRVWFGDVHVDYVPEMRAYCLRFVGVATVDKRAADNGGMLDRFLTELDARLDP